MTDPQPVYQQTVRLTPARRTRLLEYCLRRNGISVQAAITEAIDLLLAADENRYETVRKGDIRS